jgi:hypothetical protein
MPDLLPYARPFVKIITASRVSLNKYICIKTISISFPCSCRSNSYGVHEFPVRNQHVNVAKVVKKVIKRGSVSLMKPSLPVFVNPEGKRVYQIPNLPNLEVNAAKFVAGSNGQSPDSE